MNKNSNQLFKNFLTRYPAMNYLEDELVEACNMLVECAKADGKILICGNGGSSADSEHMAGELIKSFMLPRRVPASQRDKLEAMYGEDGTFIADNLQRGIQAIPLGSFQSFFTAYLNDCSPETVFAQGVYAFGKPNDILIGISTSGNSKNVMHATKVAKMLGLKTMALTGKTGGKLNNLCDITLKAPSTHTPDIQEYHLPIYHLLCAVLESEMFFENK